MAVTNLELKKLTINFSDVEDDKDKCILLFKVKDNSYVPLFKKIGVYLVKYNNEIIYVGRVQAKGRALNARVSQHFRENDSGSKFYKKFCDEYLGKEKKHSLFIKNIIERAELIIYYTEKSNYDNYINKIMAFEKFVIDLHRPKFNNILKEERFPSSWKALAIGEYKLSN